jgi:hypothetical protein
MDQGRADYADTDLPEPSYRWVYPFLAIVVLFGILIALTFLFSSRFFD